MIGIIVGAGSALLIVFITLCVCFRHGSRRRRRRRHKLGKTFKLLSLVVSYEQTYSVIVY